jgi:hypothetical protein
LTFPGSQRVPLVFAWCTRLVASAFLGSALLGLGCASPQLYTTAYSHRGSSEFSLAVDPVYVASLPGKQESPIVWLGDVQARWRFEAGEHCDIGFLLGLPRLGLDLKCAFLQTKNHALALSASASATPFEGWVNAPLLYTYRKDGWALTMSGGIAGLGTNARRYTLTKSSGGLPYSVSADVAGTYLRGGLSFSFGGHPRWQPEVNVYHQVRGDRVTFVTFGIGFHFGGPIQATDPFAPADAEPAVEPPPPAPEAPPEPVPGNRFLRRQ